VSYETILFLVFLSILAISVLSLSVFFKLGFFQWASRLSQIKLDADLPDGYVVKGLISKDFIKLKKIKIAGHIFYICEGLVAGEEGEEETVFIVPVAAN